MKTALLFVLAFVVSFNELHAQKAATSDQQLQLTALIGKYSAAREQRDTTLLKQILTQDIDQLVSSGEWRNGLTSAVKGMQNSSAENPGSRTLTVDRIKMLSAEHAIVDCRYDIKNADGTIRRMWSSFVVVIEKGSWKIAAIRNMLPAAQ